MENRVWRIKRKNDEPQYVYKKNLEYKMKSEWQEQDG